MAYNVSPLDARTFPAAELWLILAALGVVSPDIDLPAESAESEAAIDAARSRLTTRNDLVISYGQAAATLSPELIALVQPAAFPQAVFVANIADVVSRGDSSQVVCFSWTPEALVVNWVDEAGLHHFERYPPAAAAATVRNYVFRVSALDVDEPIGQASTTAGQLGQAMAEARQVASLMSLARAQSDRPLSGAVGWFVSRRTLWLLPRDAASSADLPRPVSVATLAGELLRLVHQTLAAA